MKYENLWEKYSDPQKQECESFCKGYMNFLSKGKTERECVQLIVKDLDAAGYKPLSEYKELKKGDKVYTVHMNKAVVMFNIGEEPLEKGMNILGAHIDSPRLDVKQNPLYEDTCFAYLDTHYYGGIKKYQWVAIPLAIHGVIAKKDGTSVSISIGENPGDPVFFISDLLPHLAQEQMEKKGAKLIEGEALDIIVGNKPLKFTSDSSEKDSRAKSGSEMIKAGVLEILEEKYGMAEEDFISAELEIVPAGEAREADIFFIGNRSLSSLTNE